LTISAEMGFFQQTRLFSTIIPATRLESCNMEDATRKEIAERLDELADQQQWNPELWQRCYDLVGAHRDNELLAYVHDDLIHYSGEFHSRNLLGFRVKPDRYQMENYRQEFRGIASALREHLSLNEAKKKYLA
jgi:hypothetical protein